jgi:hypothetical protein
MPTGGAIVAPPVLLDRNRVSLPTFDEFLQIKSSAALRPESWAYRCGQGAGGGPGAGQIVNRTLAPMASM